MLEDKSSKTFEEIFNEWYKEFLNGEKMMNEDIKNAKIFREEKLAQARREAADAIKSYEMEQKDKLDAEKEKVKVNNYSIKFSFSFQMNVAKNNFEQLDSEFNSQVAAIQMDYKQNKEKVVDYLIENIFNVKIELPENIRKQA